MRNTVVSGLLAAAISAALLAGCGGSEPPAETSSQPAETAPAADQAAPVSSDTADAPAATDAPADAAAPTDAAAEPQLRKRLMDSTAQQDEWVPELIASTVESPTEILRRADEAMKANRLEQGENNALSLYLSVLEKEPDNAEAKAGVDAVVAALVTRGDTLLTQARFNEATRLAGVVAQVRPDDPAVQAFKAKVDAGREVGLLLGEAQRLAAAGKVVSPEGENAAAIYRELLRTDASNVAAKQGLEKLEADLIAQALKAGESGNYEEAERVLADAGRVQPGSSAVQNASARLVEMRSDRTAPLFAEANAAIDAKQFDRAAELVKQIEQVSAQANGIDELRTKLENARSYSTLKPGQAVSDALTSGGKGPEMVVLPLGSFQMGSPEGEDDRKGNEGPQHAVTLKRGFAIARTETTVAQFRRFVTASGFTPTSTSSGTSTIYDERSGAMVERSGTDWSKDHSGNQAGDNLPVVHVSWTDALAYAAWLSKETGKTYRLPSESEFEFALRAGGSSRYPWGEGDPPAKIANLTGEDDRSASGRNWVNAFDDYGDGFWGAAPVGSFTANRYGLHDLAGNVSEWVEDCWHENYQRAPADGSAWVNEGCNRRVIRGASWASAPDQARSAFRLTAGPATTNARLGFRVVRDL